MSNNKKDLLSMALDESGLDGDDIAVEYENIKKPAILSQPSTSVSQRNHSSILNESIAKSVMKQQQQLYSKGVSMMSMYPGQGYTTNMKLGQTSLSQLERLIDIQQQGKMSKQAQIISKNDISKLWKNDDISGNRMLSRPRILAGANNEYVITMGNSVMTGQVEEEIEGEDEEDEMGYAETYADYMPPKLKVGIKHPDPVVETSSLASVAPPDVWYKLSIPEEVYDEGHLSALQLEAIVYACQKHEHFLPNGDRAGYLIGDGAGVGKGRTIAGLIYENYLCGRKRAIWVSASADLKYDAERDLKDIGAGKVDVYPLNKCKYAKLTSNVNGPIKKGVIFSTYSALIGESQSGGKYKTRLKQLLHWCGDDFDGLIVFDECHKAKNLCPVGSSKPTKTGLTVLELQKQLPKARLVYASATGASEPKNMAYMVRLGIWGEGTPFREFSDYIQAVERRGVGAMEIVAMDMKLRGMYIARQLSFSGVSFKIQEIPLEKSFMDIYDDSVRLWVKARDYFSQAAELIQAEQRMKKTMWGQFWSAHQRFFKYLCIASKVKHAVRIARESVKCGKCAVIGLQSTGEARTLETLEDMGGELNDFVSTAKGVIQTLVEKHFPAPDRRRVNRLLGLGDPLFQLEDIKVDASDRKARKSSVKYKESSSDPDASDSDSSTGKKKSKKKGKKLKSAAAKRKAAAAKKIKRKKARRGSDDSDFELSDDSDENSDDSAKSDDDDSPNPSEDSPSEADSDDMLADELDSDDSDPWVRSLKSKQKEKNSKSRALSAILMPQVSKGLQAPNYAANGLGSVHPMPTKDFVERACMMKDELMELVEKLGNRLPPNTLDELIDDLGGPENVAEMTGRKGRVVSNNDGTIQYESRSEVDVPLETLNLTEKSRFMNGEKFIAIISEAASSGISLQADRRVKNQRRRVHITLELPWSADRAIQQFGRTHRSNQVNAPEYLFLISDLAGERRFASIVAKRLESLGALTHGDRRATESRDLSSFNIDNKYGRLALDSIMKAIMEYETPIVPPPSDYNGDFFSDIRGALVGVGMVTEDDQFSNMQSLEKDFNNIAKFLNRLLGITVELQNRLFDYFTATLHAIISKAKKAGRFDMGITDLGASDDKVQRVKSDIFVMKHATGKARVELHTVQVERGISWERVMGTFKSLTEKDEGFYLSTWGTKQVAILVVMNEKSGKKFGSSPKKDQKIYTIQRPNTGATLQPDSLSNIKSKYKKVKPEEAEAYWKDHYDKSNLTCSHAYWRGSCKRVIMGQPCDVGLRQRMFHILSGSVLSVWTKVELVLATSAHGSNSKMQIMRVRTSDNNKIIGTMVPLSCYGQVINVLAEDCTEKFVDTY